MTKHTVNSVLNLNENREINLNISDDVTLYASYTAGRNAIITNQEMGYTNTDLLFRNQENIAEYIISQQIFTIKDFFNSNFINEYLQ